MPNQNPSTENELPRKPSSPKNNRPLRSKEAQNFLRPLAFQVFVGVAVIRPRLQRSCGP